MNILGFNISRANQPAPARKEPSVSPPKVTSPTTSETGYRPTPEDRIKHLYRKMWVDPELRATIHDIRHMNRVDPRVKKIHSRMAHTTVKGGLIIETTSPTLRRAWQRFVRRLELHRIEKMSSDARGLVMEGNLPLQWVLQEGRVASGVRMPTETLIPQVDINGRFSDPANAYEQHDLQLGQPIASFAAWQLSLARLTPDNYDDLGSWGRPYLDAARTPWKQLTMTEEDLVIRRRERAPQKLAHILEGATNEELEAYRDQLEQDRKAGVHAADYYLNKRGGVTAVGGDANLDQIADVSHLLDTFFAGAPAPKGLFGYVGDLSRDVLEDLKRDYYDEIDALQDTLAYGYEMGFRLDLLLSGKNPDAMEFDVKFSERRTETPNQAADRALKYQALGGASMETILRTANLDPQQERERREQEAADLDPYPEPNNIAGGGDPTQPTSGKVSITPGNARKGESATSISHGGAPSAFPAHSPKLVPPNPSSGEPAPDDADPKSPGKKKLADQPKLFEYHLKYQLVTNDEVRDFLGLPSMQAIGKPGGDAFPTAPGGDDGGAPPIEP